MIKQIRNALIDCVVLLATLLVAFMISPQRVSAATDYSGTYVIASSVGNQQVLDVAGGGVTNKTNVQIYRANGTNAQKFRIEKWGSYYRIISVASGKVLDVAGGSLVNQGNVQIYSWNRTKAQLWSIQASGTGEVYIINAASGKAIDVAGGKNTNRTNVQQYRLNRTAAQKWKLHKTNTPEETEEEKSSTATKPATAQTEGIVSGYVYSLLSAKNENYAVEVAGGKTDNGRNVQLYRHNLTQAQQWKFIYINGFYKIINIHSGKALDVKSAKKENGANIQQWKDNGTRAQLWRVTKESDGTYTITSALDQRYVLDLSGGKVNNGQNIQLFKSNGTKAQRWTIVDRVSKMAVAKKTSQVILVEGASSGSKAVVSFHEKDGKGRWQETVRTETAYIGYNGLGKTIEGDRKTPVGVFYPDKAFGILANPGCPMGYTKVDSTHYWNGDSYSTKYNQFVSTRNYTAFRTSASEHIISYGKVYNYCLNIGYNKAGTKRKGSCLFLHCIGSNPYTAGCVAVPEKTMKTILQKTKSGVAMVIDYQKNIKNY